MNYFQKIFMLTALAQGVCVPEACPETKNVQSADQSIDVQEVIHKIVMNRADEFSQQQTQACMDTVIVGMMTDLDEALAKTQAETHLELKAAVKNLKNNPKAFSSLITIAGYLKPETRKIIEKCLPSIKPFLAFLGSKKKF